MAVRAGAGLPRADHQARPGARPRHAGRGSLGGGAGAWSLAGVFPSGAGSAWAARRGGGDRSQARRPDLASAAQGRELHLWARPALHAKKVAISNSGPGTRLPGVRRRRLHAYNLRSHREQERRWVEQAETAYARLVAGWNPRGPKGAHGRRNGGATVRAARQGLHLRPCSSPRGHPCATEGYGGFKWSSQHGLCELFGGTGPEPRPVFSSPGSFAACC